VTETVLNRHDHIQRNDSATCAFHFSVKYTKKTRLRWQL